MKTDAETRARLIPRMLGGAFLCLIVISTHATDALLPESLGLCEHCHGPGGNSVIPGNPVLARQSAPYLARQLEDYLAGRRVHTLMQQVAENLEASEMLRIAQYFAASPLTIQAVQGDPELREEGHKLAQALACEGCHPAKAEIESEVPRLRGQHADYLRTQLSAFRDGSRVDGTGVMAAAAALLQDDDIAALAAWFASTPAD
jgi:cytochrome c553